MTDKKKVKHFWRAVAVMIGYVIGVGMFGLPFLISRSGLLAFFVFLVVLGPIQLMLHKIYASIILATESYHRLPGYTEKYIGKRWKIIVFIAKMFGNYGALLAYIIITGIFLNQLLYPFFGGSEFLYATCLFALEAVILFFGINMIAKAELVMTSLLLLVVVLITWRGWGAIIPENYNLVSWKYFLIPYGAILFSLDGNGSLPMVAKILNKDKEAVKKVVYIGTLIPIAIIIIFTLVIVGITGSGSTPDALTGVREVLDDGVVFFALIFGILTMATSFFGVAESIKETLWWDFKLNKNLAWALAVFVPYILYLTGLKNLINVISFTGAIAGGLSALVLVYIFKSLRERDDKLVLFKHKPISIIVYLLMALFIAGIIYEVYSFIAL